MAGDWIKMRADLHTHPKVVRIMSALNADRLLVVGGLHAVWCLFDAHSADGVLDGYTEKALDSIIGCPGFAAAMVSVGWLVNNGESLATPRFDEHNGQSAKRRATETERKRASRSDEKVSAPEADKKRTREEKRREEVNPSAFAQFWAAYPKKVAKADAEKAWGKIKPDANLQNKISKAVSVASRTPEWVKDAGQFIPNAATWLNGKRWEDSAPGLTVVGAADPRFAGAK